MSTDFDRALAGLAAEADRVRLAPADKLRATGDARTRRAWVTGAAVMVAVVLVGVAVTVARQRSPQASMIAPVPFTEVPSPTPTPSISPTATPTPPADVCNARMLGFDQRTSGFAMGSVYFTFRFFYGGATACTLPQFPVLTYVDGQGRTATVPTKPDGAGGPVLVPVDGALEFVLHEVNGTGGYSPDSPECAHPATYHQVSVALSTGPVPLRSDDTLTVQCGDIWVGPWTLSR
jgi:hypothetical protein